MLLSITSSSLVNAMVCPFSDTSKFIVSPSLASASAWRSEPGPLSLVLVTVITFARAEITAVQTSAKQIRAHRLRRADRQVPFFFIGESYGRGAGVGRGRGDGV